MAGGAVARRRAELQAQGLSYQESLIQAVNEIRGENHTRADHQRPVLADRTPDTGGSPPVPATQQPRHGVHTGRRVNAVAQSFIDMVADDATCGYITHSPGFRPALDRWAMAEARVSLYDAWLEEHDDLTDTDARYAAEMLRLWTARAEKACQALGLDPASRARLGSDLASMVRVRTEYDADIEELVSLTLGGGDVLSSHEDVWTDDGTTR